MKSDSKKHTFKAAETDIKLSSRDEVKIMNIALTQKATRNIDILSRHLDSSIFDVSDYIDAIKNLSISSQFSKIRILINDSKPMTQNGHRMIDLIQQLTSSIEVREINEEYKSYNEAFSLFDGKGVVYLRYADRYEGFANFDRPRLAAELLNTFNEMWEHSVPDINLRRLSL